MNLHAVLLAATGDLSAPEKTKTRKPVGMMCGFEF
jgi:hypothetical protein